ncbi:MAG TPA: hypothetical protein VIF61_11865, partial [Methylocystis sp.]
VIANVVDQPELRRLGPGANDHAVSRIWSRPRVVGEATRSAYCFGGKLMAGNSILAHMKSKLDLARREMRGAVINLDVPDDKLLELRADARRLFEEVKELERKAAKKGLFGFFGF